MTGHFNNILRRNFLNYRNCLRSPINLRNCGIIRFIYLLIYASLIDKK